MNHKAMPLPTDPPRHRSLVDVLYCFVPGILAVGERGVTSVLMHRTFFQFPYQTQNLPRGHRVGTEMKACHPGRPSALLHQEQTKHGQALCSWQWLICLGLGVGQAGRVGFEGETLNRRKPHKGKL